MTICCGELAQPRAPRPDGVERTHPLICRTCQRTYQRDTSEAGLLRESLVMAQLDPVLQRQLEHDLKRRRFNVGVQRAGLEHKD